MSLVPLALAALVSAGPELRAVRVTTLDSRTALRVLTSEGVAAAVVTREGGEVVIRIAAPGADGLLAPPVQAPLAAIRLERQSASTLVRVAVAPEVPFEVDHEPGMTTLVFGEQPASELRGRIDGALYARLFPAGAGDAADSAPPSRSEQGAGELSLGRFALRPYLTVSWVDADLQAFESPQPVRARYLQLGPGVTLSAPLSLARLAAEYEPRLRYFSSLPRVEEPTHAAGIRLELPLGSRTQLRAGHRFTRATLETTVVDPGREYFFDLSRFTFHHTTLAARIELGPRLFLDGDAGWRRADFDEAERGFFDYESRAARAGLGYDLRDDLRAVVSYSFERIPPSPGRTVVEASGHAFAGSLSGSIGPLMTGALSAGYSSRRSPRAEGASRSFHGVTFGASLRRELGVASSLDLQLGRSTQLSGFETNAYYVSNSAALQLSAPLPFEVSGSASLAWLRNDYPNVALGLSVPRRDEILSWSVGLGRPLGWRAWIRADYRRERRDSNLPGFDVTTDGYVVQLGLGLPRASR